MEPFGRAGIYRNLILASFALVILFGGCGGGGGGGTSGAVEQLATVQGIVTDEAGNPLDNALVIVGESSWAGHSGRDGSFAIPNVRYGSHPVRAIRNGRDLGMLSSVSVSAKCVDVGEVKLPPPSVAAPALTNLRLTPSSGPDGTLVTARVEAANLGSSGTVTLASPELEKTWLMTLETGTTYKASVTIAARSGIAAYRFFAAGIDGTKAGVAEQGAVFTLTGAAAANANVSGVWKFYSSRTSPTPEDTASFFWIHQDGTTLVVLSHPGSSSGSVSGNSLNCSLTDSGGRTYTATGTVQGTKIEGTWTRTGGDSGTFVAYRVMEEGNVPSDLGNGPVTISPGQYFDLSAGTASATGDFRFLASAGFGFFAATYGASEPEDRSENGFRVELAFQPLLDPSMTWLDNSTVFAPSASYVPCILLVKTGEGRYGILWISSATAGGMTFRYFYPYRGNSYTWGTPPAVSGLAASGPVQQGDNVVAGWTGTAGGSASIVRYDTWIDSPGTMAESVASPARNFGTPGLSVGTHTLFVKAVQSDRLESAVGSVTFSVVPLVMQATIGLTNVDSGTGTGTMSLLRTSFGLTTNGFNAAPPDFLSVGSPQLLPASPVLGQTWSHSGISNGYTINTTATVTSLSETVTVTAGTFSNCLRIEESNSFDPAYVASSGGRAVSHRTRWFAPGVGPVKYEAVYVDASLTVVVTATGQLVSRSLAYTAPNNLWPLAVGNSWVIQETDPLAPGQLPCTWSVTTAQ
jgi:hypothetical protein